MRASASCAPCAHDLVFSVRTPIWQQRWRARCSGRSREGWRPVAESAQGKQARRITAAAGARLRPAWIKVEDKGILSIHQQVISRNYRISLSTSDNRHFVLHIRNVQESDRGGYMCQINTSPMMSQVGYLDVLVVEESSSDVVVREGSNVTLTCKARGYPRPTITWRREDNEPIPLGAWKNGKKTQTLVQTYEGEYLTVTRVSRVHMGAYLCIANNNVPSPVSRRIMLHVHFPPVIWIPLQLVGAPQRANVTLDCHSEAYPPAVNYWAKDNHKIFLDNEKYSLSVRKGGYKAHMQLGVRQLRERDFGTYRCLSENLLGSTEGSVKLYDGKYFASEDGFSEDNEPKDGTSQGK
ncbi:hypothetical protein HPB52_001052 [Rhipicephalus sanguineus]|uniref:Ig-like domain-containing protein n=1 Tax=Rhipicephalus sanguineus TaxID=34632 RepID=A0A9D4PUV2_RHISA|nr:hypothetical protein HPB52_001052 [Rhipicephalus sanguineus]